MNKTYEAQRSAAMKIADEELKERILRGLDVLKAQYGEGWVEHIDKDLFRMEDPTVCLLGQLEPTVTEDPDLADYYSALERIDDDVEDDPSSFAFEREHESYTELTEAWLQVAGLDK